MSADQCNTVTQNNMVAMYYSGEGVEVRKSEAYKWFYIAGELGNEDAVKGMKRDEVNQELRLAKRWLKRFED